MHTAYIVILKIINLSLKRGSKMNRMFTTTIMFISLLACNSNGVSGDPETIWVNPYTRSDGTYIYGHYRNVFSESDKQYCCSDSRNYWIKISSGSIILDCNSGNKVEKFAAEEAILSCKDTLMRSTSYWDDLFLQGESYSGKPMSDKEADLFLKKTCKGRIVSILFLMVIR
jgi:hypothetical protein